MKQIRKPGGILITRDEGGHKMTERLKARFRTTLAAVLATVITIALAFTMLPIASVNADTAASSTTTSSTTTTVGQLPPGASEDKFEGDELLVSFNPSAPLEQQVAQLGAQLAPLRTARALDTGSAVKAVEVIEDGSSEQGNTTALLTLASDIKVADALTVANKATSVAKAQPNYIYTFNAEDPPTLDGAVQLGLSDPYAQSSRASDDVNQWYLYKAKAISAWDDIGASSTVRVAVIDSGLLMTHDDIKGNVDTARAWDVVTRSALTRDISGHGTHVAGIIGGKTNNRIGIAGVTNNKAIILPVNVFENNQQHPTSPIARTSSIVAAIDYLIRLRLPDLRVINMSLGMYGARDAALEAKINEAVAAGILVVAAAGNGQTTEACYPSDFPNVVGVTATDSNNKAASFSDHNNNKDIAAPGVALLSTWGSANNAYAFSSGTSMASPVVAGAAALLFSADPTLTPAKVKDVLYSTATDLGKAGKDEYFGNGLVNADAAAYSLVGRRVAKVELKGAPKSLPVGAAAALKATVTPSIATDRALSWSSSSSQVATVGSNGQIKALKPGTTTITAASTSNSAARATYKLTVTTPIKSVALSKKKATLKVKKSLKLKLKFTPAKGINKAVVWRSSNTKVARVNASGKVVALKRGKATITATSTDGKKKATCKLTIKK